MKNYFINCRTYEQNEQELQRKRAEEHELSERAGRPAILENEVLNTYQFNQSLVGLFGSEKCRKYIEAELDFANCELDKANKTLTDVKNGFVEAKYIKEKNWGIAGGIAEGLAGPAAGVAVALDTMEQNKQAAEYNRWAAEANMYLRANQKRKENEARGVVAQKQKAVDALKEELHRLDLRICVDDISPEELFKKIKITEKRTQLHAKEEGKEYFTVSMKIASSYKMQGLPKEMSICMDGTLTATLKLPDKEIGTAILPLPKNGLPCDGTPVSISGICNNYIKTSQRITLTVNQNNLWLMEL